MTRNCSLPRRSRRATARPTVVLSLEQLEDRIVPSVVTVDANQTIRTATNQILGANLAWYDSALNTPQTQQMVQAAGLNFFRFPGGGSADTWHFNVGPNFNGAGTSPSMASFIASVEGTGMVTLNYGTGSPQEAAAFLAYLNGNVNDTTEIGIGMQWSDASNSWVPVDWKTAGYWAGLRAATPLAQDDGLNFLRIGRTAPFGIKYFEIGNEEYGNWEVDEHATPHDPATYVTFASQFAALAAQIDPNISIGIDGSGTGGSYSQIPGNWTAQVLQQCAEQGFIPGFISDHNYIFDSGSENDTNLLLHSVTDPNAIGYGGPLNWAGRAEAYRSLINQYLGSAGAGVQLLATEFNSVSSNPTNETTSLVNGLWLADALGGLLETEYNGAIFWDLRNSYTTSYYNPNFYGWRTGGDFGMIGSDDGSPPDTGTYVPYPTYFAEQLVSQMVHTGDTVVQASSDDPTLSAYAVLEQNGHLDLLVINKNPSTDLTEQFNIAGFTPSGQATVWQYGEAQDTAQSQTTDGQSSLANWTQTLTVNGSSFSFLFPQYSMTVLDLAPATAPMFTSDTSTTFTVGKPGSFTVTASGSPPPTLSENSSDTLPSGVTFDANTGVLSGTAAAGTAGIYILHFTATSSTGFDDQNFTLTVNQAPAITSGNSAVFTVGQGGSFTVTATGSPKSALTEKGALPSGLTFTDNGDSTATLQGTPAAGTNGTYHFTITADNGVGSDAVQNFTLTVDQAATITSGNSAAFTVGHGGSFIVTAIGPPTPVLTESGALPSGVTFRDNGNGTATLGGTPAAGTSGIYQFTITADNGVGSDATQRFSLTVNSAPSPPPPLPPPPPPPPPTPPSLNVPPLLAFFDELLGGVETVNGNGTETIVDRLFGFPLLVSTFDSSGNLVSVTWLGFNVTFLFER